jgi:hypothetical protein
MVERGHVPCYARQRESSRTSSSQVHTRADRHVGQQETHRHIPQTRRPDQAEGAAGGGDKVALCLGWWRRWEPGCLDLAKGDV